MKTRSTQRAQTFLAEADHYTSILPTVKLLSLGGARLTPKVLDHNLHHDLMLQLVWCFLAHLLILEYLDHHQKFMCSSLYYPEPLHEISSKSFHNMLSNVVHKKQTNRLIDRQTNQHYQKHYFLYQGGKNKIDSMERDLY